MGSLRCSWPLRWLCVCGIALAGLGAFLAAQGQKPAGDGKAADAKHLGGEPESIVQVANLVYAGVKSKIGRAHV